jgi:hypothetical protein
MNPVDYLLAGFLTIMAVGAFTLVVSAQSALDGFEDMLGFHFGIAPAVTSLFSIFPEAGLAYEPAYVATAAVPSSVKGRRKSGSKPPLLPTNLDIADLKPRPSPKLERAKKSAGGKADAPGQAQLSFPSDQSPAT